MTDNTEIAGLLYKKRGGFSKMLPMAWQHRFVKLTKNGVLMYFDTDSPDLGHIANDSNARGRLDLKHVDFDLIVDQPIVGSPYPYIIKVCPVSNEVGGPPMEKWKLCAERKIDFDKWCKALQKYADEHDVASILSAASDDVVPVETPGGASPVTAGRLIGRRRSHGGSVSSSNNNTNNTLGNTTPFSSSSGGAGSGSVHRRRRPPPGRGVGNKVNMQEAVEWTMTLCIVGICWAKCCFVMKQQQQNKVDEEQGQEGDQRSNANMLPIISDDWQKALENLAYLSLCLFVVGHSLNLRWRRAHALKLANQVLQEENECLKVAVQEARAEAEDNAAKAQQLARAAAAAAAAEVVAQESTSLTRRLSTSFGGLNSISEAMGITSPKNNNNNHNNNISLRERFGSEDVGSEKCGTSAAATAAGSSAASYAAVTAASISTGASSSVGEKIVPGTTLPYAKTTGRNSAPAHTWSIGEHRLFNVRVGPDYARHGKKAASGVPLYEPFAADVYCSNVAVDNVARRVQLPDTSHIDTHHACVAPIIVIQTQFPAEPPSSLFSQADDGPCNTLVMYFRITQSTCDELKDLSTASAAVKLFHKWTERSRGTNMAGLKMIGDITNLESFGLPSWVNSWNCKPVLIKPNISCTVTREANFMEIDVNIHKWRNVAKQGMSLIDTKTALAYCEIGFVIQGENDEELPETLFACFGLNRPSKAKLEYLFD